MNEVAAHPEDIPMGNMKMIYNSAINYNIINEEFKEWYWKLNIKF